MNKGKVRLLRAFLWEVWQVCFVFCRHSWWTPDLMGSNQKYKQLQVLLISDKCETSYLFRALLLFHTVSNNNVNNFPPEPLNYSLKAALFPCGAVNSRVLVLSIASTYTTTQTLAGLNAIRLIQRHRVTRAPLKTPHVQNRAECKHLEHSQ